MTASRWVVPALVVVAVALVAAADRLASSGPLGFAATAALLLGAPALVAGLSRLASGSRAKRLALAPSVWLSRLAFASVRVRRLPGRLAR